MTQQKNILGMNFRLLSENVPMCVEKLQYFFDWGTVLSFALPTDMSNL